MHRVRRSEVEAVRIGPYAAAVALTEWCLMTPPGSHTSKPLSNGTRCWRNEVSVEGWAEKAGSRAGRDQGSGRCRLGRRWLPADTGHLAPRPASRVIQHHVGLRLYPTMEHLLVPLDLRAGCSEGPPLSGAGAVLGLHATAPLKRRTLIFNHTLTEIRRRPATH